MILLLPLTKGAMKQYAVSFLNNIDYELAFLDESSFAIDELERYQGKLRFFDKGNSFKKLLWSFSPVGAYRLVAQAVEMEKKKIVVANGEFLPFVFFLSFFARLRGVEVAVCWHDVTPHVGRFSNYFFWLLAFVNSLIAVKVVTHSKHYLNMLQSLPLYRSKVYYVPLPPYELEPINNVSSANKLLEQNELQPGGYFIFLGRLEYYKGVRNLIEFFSELDDYKLLIAGSGEVKYVQALAQEIELSSNIYLYEGFLEEDDFLFLLSNSKAIILPYIHASQSSLPYISASLSVPIITTIGTGISDLVEELKGYSYASDKELLDILTKSNLRPTIYDRKAHLAEFKVLMNKVIN
jgi:glycosyltransferase involved in cell wall biosynthesis